MKILNLYAGIGGNRKLWGDSHEITAVEYNKDIAALYQKFYPKDKVVVGDAHQYLLDHYKEFDFIWASPPCPSHSRARWAIASATDHKKFPDKQKAIYPDMKLYQEIIFLMHFASKNTKWVIENVKPYYEPLIPAKEIARHLFWTNFDITYKEINNDVVIGTTHGGSEVFGINLKGIDIKNKRQILRNMVDPKVGLHILNESQGMMDEEAEQQRLI